MARGHQRNASGPERKAQSTSQSFSTEMVQERDRLPLLQSVVNEILAGAMEMGELADARAFEVAVDAAAPGALRLNWTRNLGLRTERAARHLRDDVDGITFALGIKGEGLIEQCDRRARLKPNELIVVDFSKPMSSLLPDTEMLLLQLPRSVLGGIDFSHLAGAVFDERAPLVPLLNAYARTAFEQVATGTGLPEIAERHLVELASSMCRSGPGQQEDRHLSERSGVRAARVSAMRETLARHYLNPMLSMRHLAASIDLSERSGHLLFEEAGLNFSDCLYALRLDLARERLKVSSERVIDIAFAVGFSDVSHFHRLFKRRFGCTPKEMRHDRVPDRPAPKGR